jgi:hypothetical protein
MIKSDSRDAKKFLKLGIVLTIFLGSLGFIWRAENHSSPKQNAQRFSVNEERVNHSAKAPSGSLSPALSRQHRAPQIKSVAREDFRAHLVDVQKSLPTRSDLQRLSPKDVHRTPKPIVDAGLKLSQIAQTLAEYPEWAQDAIGFYRECSGRDELASSIRALCFSNLEPWSEKSGIEFEEHQLVPPRIRRLAADLRSLQN